MEELKQYLREAKYAEVEFVICGAEQSAEVAGSWSGWAPSSLHREKEGDTWYGRIRLPAGTYQYKVAALNIDLSYELLSKVL